MFLESISTEVAFDLISLQIALVKYGSYVQRLYLTVDSTKLIIHPRDALELAFDYKKIIRLNWRLKNYCMDYLTKKQSDFFGNICDDIIKTYDELIDIEKENEGNLLIANSFVFSQKDPYDLDYTRFNYNGKEINTDKLKEF